MYFYPSDLDWKLISRDKSNVKYLHSSAVLKFGYPLR